MTPTRAQTNSKFGTLVFSWGSESEKHNIGFNPWTEFDIIIQMSESSENVLIANLQGLELNLVILVEYCMRREAE